MVVKYEKLARTVLVLSLLFLSESCHETEQSSTSLKTSTNSNLVPYEFQDFIPKKYEKITPLAYIENIKNYQDVEQEFILEEDSFIDIFAVGEADAILAEADENSLFRGDDIEFLFNIDKTTSDNVGQGKVTLFNFSWLDGDVTADRINFTKQGATYNGFYDRTEKAYVAEIKFPWKVLQSYPLELNKSLGFNLIVGDCDNELTQKTKIAWQKMNRKYTKSMEGHGNIIPVKEASNQQEKFDSLFIMPLTPIIDGIVEKEWDNLLPIPINQVIRGEVKDKEDLSAWFKSSWDTDNLYFLIKIFDSGKKLVQHDKIRQMQTFVDYGYILDTQGNDVWTMHILDAEPAGGAKKNKRISTTIKLKAGRYLLKYHSDESHSTEWWDDLPPKVPFYGIRLYNNK